MRGSTVGIDDSLKGSSEAHFLLLSALDWILSSVLVAPSVITYWRGTWTLLEIYLLPDDPLLSSAVSFALGVVTHLVMTLGQHVLTKSMDPASHRLIYYLVSRGYSYLYGVACVSLWRGGWKALDMFSGDDPLVVCSLTLIALGSMAGMKTLRNISAAPFSVALDLRKGYFDIPTMFKTGITDTFLYFLDCFFSVVVIGSLVVFVWRGVWCLTDIFLFPEDPTVSAFGSLVLGYGIVIVVFLLQAPMKWLCEWLRGFWRILAADLYIFMSFLGTINLWRGIWNLLNIYFLPEQLVLSCWITHIVSFMLLVLLNCSNSILVRGVYIDGEEPGGKCVEFPTYYLRLFFQEQRKKKLMKRSRISTVEHPDGVMVSSEKGNNCPKSFIQIEVPLVTHL